MAGGNLNLSGFTGQPDNADWLYQLGDTLQKNKFFDERAAERKQAQADREAATLDANSRFIEENEKQKLTGTLYDPVNTQLIGKLKNQSYQLLHQKVPLDQVLLAGSGIANQIHEYNQKAEMYNANKKQWLENNKNLKGINPDAVIKEADQMAFYDKDPKTGQLTLNIDKADPSHNYYADVLQKSDNPDIFNNEGMNDFVKTSGHIVQDQILKTRDARGKIITAKVDINKPSYMQSETDEQGVHLGFVPKYQIASEGESHLFHDFKDENGNNVSAPVRMVTDDVWKSMTDPVKARIIQETRKLISSHPGLNIDSPQAEHLGKAIAYDDLKSNSKEWSTFKRTDVNMQPLPPRLTVNVGGAQQPQTIDLYNGDKNNIGLKQIVDSDIEKINIKNPGKTPYTGFNEAPQQVQTTLIKQARDISGDRSLNNTNLYFHKDDNGDINLMQITGEHPSLSKDISIMTVDPLTLNIPANQNVTKVGTGKTKPETINKVINTGQSTANKTYNIKGKSYSHSELLKGGWTEDQINQAVKSGKIK